MASSKKKGAQREVLPRKCRTDVASRSRAPAPSGESEEPDEAVPVDATNDTEAARVRSRRAARCPGPGTAGRHGLKSPITETKRARRTLGRYGKRRTKTRRRVSRVLGHKDASVVARRASPPGLVRWDRMPQNLWSVVLRHLDIGDHCTTAQVSQWFRRMAVLPASCPPRLDVFLPERPARSPVTDWRDRPPPFQRYRPQERLVLRGSVHSIQVARVLEVQTQLETLVLHDAVPGDIVPPSSLPSVNQRLTRLSLPRYVMGYLSAAGERSWLQWFSALRVIHLGYFNVTLLDALPATVTDLGRVSVSDVSDMDILLPWIAARPNLLGLSVSYSASLDATFPRTAMPVPGLRRLCLDTRLLGDLALWCSGFPGLQAVRVTEPTHATWPRGLRHLSCPLHVESLDTLRHVACLETLHLSLGTTWFPQNLDWHQLASALSQPAELAELVVLVAGTYQKDPESLSHLTGLRRFKLVIYGTLHTEAGLLKGGYPRLPDLEHLELRVQPLEDRVSAEVEQRVRSSGTSRASRATFRHDENRHALVTTMLSDEMRRVVQTRSTTKVICCHYATCKFRGSCKSHRRPFVRNWDDPLEPADLAAPVVPSSVASAVPPS